MTEPNRAYAYFSLVDFAEEPEEITRLIGLSPTETWKKGELNHATQYERRFSRWSLRSRLPESDELENHVGDVLDQLQQVAAQVRKLSLKYGGVMQLVGYFHTSYPGFGLSQDAVARIAELGACVDCDFYYLYSGERDDSEP